MSEDLRTDHVKLEKSLYFNQKYSFLPGHWGAGPPGPPCYASGRGRVDENVLFCIGLGRPYTYVQCRRQRGAGGPCRKIGPGGTAREDLLPVLCMHMYLRYFRHSRIFFTVATILINVDLEQNTGFFSHAPDFSPHLFSPFLSPVLSCRLSSLFSLLSFSFQSPFPFLSCHPDPDQSLFCPCPPFALIFLFTFHSLLCHHFPIQSSVSLLLAISPPISSN